MNSSINTNRAIPRTDVGSAGLAGAVAFLLMVVFDREVYDFVAAGAAFGAVLVFLGGYVPARHKNSYMAAAAFAATLLAVLLGTVLGYPADNTVVSTALAGFLVALVGWLAPPNAQSEVMAANAEG